MKMTRFKSKSIHSLLLVFRAGLSLLVLTVAATATVRADEGTAVTEKTQASRSVVPAASETSSSSSDSSAGTGKSHWWNQFQDLNMGGLKPRIRPHFYADNSYSSNSAASRKPDPAWQARVSPGITVDLPFSDKLYSSVDYTYSFATNQGRRIHTHTNSHNIDAMTRYDLSKKTVLGLRNNTQWSEVPGAPGNTFFLETLAPEVKHQIGTKLRTGLSYIYQHFGDTAESASGGSSDFFRGGVSNDTFNDNGIKATSEYTVGPGLTLGPSFGWNVRDFSKTNSKDYWQIQPQLDGTYTLGSKTKLGAHFGWGYRRFDVGDAYDSTLLYGAKVTHLMGRKFIWDLAYDKTQADTFDTSFVFRPHGAQANILDNYDRHYRVIHNHRIGTSMTYNINEKNSANVYGGFQFSNAGSNQNVFSNDRLREKMMAVGAGYVYRLTRYVSLLLNYEFARSFQTRDNPSRSIFSMHKVTAGVNVAF